MSADGCLLGIDIGTSSVKCLVLDVVRSRPLATATREYPVLQPRPGWAEQDPDDWWRAAVQTVQAALAEAGVDGAAVRGIGLCGQMHGGVCLGADHRPLRPAIIWADARSKAQVDDLRQRIPLDEMARYAPGLPAAGFMAPTLMWLAQHEPETLDNMTAFLLPKDYVRLHLTGEVATEVSDNAATWLFDVAAGRWSGWLVEACGLDMRYLPPVLGSTDVAGYLTADAAALLGLPAGIPVVAGSADQPAQALGHGLYDPGTALVTIGTGGQVFSALDTPQIDPALRYYIFNHAVPGRWYAAAATLAAGLSLRWLRDLLHLDGWPDAYAHLSALAADVPPGAGGLVFLPYLVGERTPHMDPDASGLFLGLRLFHEAGHLARAVMEGVAFSLMECLTLQPPPQRVIASGGASRSPVWLQIQADIFGVPLHVAAAEDHACVGAALVAGVGCGVYDSFAAACAPLPDPVQVIEPNPAQVAFYAERRERYRSLYPQLAETMHWLSADG